MRSHIKTILHILKGPAYWKVAVTSSVIFALAILWLVTRTTTISSFFSMAWDGSYFSALDLGRARILGVIYVALYWLITIATVIVFGVSVALLAWLFRHSSWSHNKSTTGSGIGGILTGLFASGCPICGTFLLSLIGVSGGIGIFPLKGLELKVLSLGLMAGSVVFASKRIARFKSQGYEGEMCGAHAYKSLKAFVTQVTSLKRGLVWAIVIILALNQFLIGSFVPKARSTSRSGGLRALFGVQQKAQRQILAPKVNPDGKTTSIVPWPTITEVPAEPKGLEPLEAAKAVMIATGKPFYAPEDISFDDPLNAQNKWGAYETSIRLSDEQEARYQKLITTMMTCSYCCGGPNNITMIRNCGCAHAKAVRGFYRFMIQNYGDKYNDEELVGESHRWYALWYPKGMVEDYLLATGRGDVIGHKTHGGAGADGRHGL